ncbi:MAG: 3-phosphoglycerate dehydrogenase [Clostridia bacterium]|nr:3-phosphoglycerate dehydrogenase [Clostridia bacterium]
MKEILRLNEISPLVNSVFADKYIMTKDAKEPVGILVRSFNMHEYNLAPSVLCVGRAGAGTNNIPLDRYADEGVVVFNTPGANANAVKELVLSDMLMCGRRLAEGIAWTNGLSDGEKTVAEQVEGGKKAFAGSEIKDKTLGIMGLGAIGRLVADAALAMGMKVLAVDPYLTKEAASTLSEDVRILDNIDDMFALADYLTFHVPLTNETRGFINRESIAKMKDGVNIINCSRGELVDDDSIIEACESGKVNRYVTDFPNSALLNRKNIICTPHLGASTAEAEDNCAIMAAKQIVNFVEKGNIVNSVNYPAVHLDAKGAQRVVVLFKGDESVGEEAQEILAPFKVVGFVVKTKKAYGAALFNLNSEADEKAINALKGISGVTRALVI